MNKYILASSNRNKVLEIKAQLQNIVLYSLSDLDDHSEIAETGLTLEENALIKSSFIFKKYGFPCISDDTGLEVDALNGLPGVLSARYSGVHGDAEANMKKLLNNLNSFSNRGARFRTVVCLKNKNDVLFFEGVVNGCISTEKRGLNGFGYDPIFIPNGFDQTFAEMSVNKKNNISHRHIAIQKLIMYLQDKT